jgi:hypothetical protein
VNPFYYLFGLVIIFVVAIPCSFVDQHLWNWFVGPYFHLPYMHLWVAMGFGFLVGTNQQARIDITTGEMALKLIGHSLANHAGALVLGWLVFHLLCHGI